MSGSVICPDCKGNGYIGNSKETDTQTDCHTCKSQGSLDLNTAEDLEMDSSGDVWDEIWSDLQFKVR
jgi:DnaJ-class molecular chaperone